MNFERLIICPCDAADYPDRYVNILLTVMHEKTKQENALLDHFKITSHIHAEDPEKIVLKIVWSTCDESD